MIRSLNARRVFRPMQFADPHSLPVATVALLRNMARPKKQDRMSTGRITDIREYLSRTSFAPGTKRKALYDSSSDDEIVVASKASIVQKLPHNGEDDQDDAIAVAVGPSAHRRNPLANLSPEHSQNKRRRVLASVCVVKANEGNGFTHVSKVPPSRQRSQKATLPTVDRAPTESKRPERNVKRASFAPVAALSDASDDDLGRHATQPSRKPKGKKSPGRSPSVFDADFVSSESSMDDFSEAATSEDSPMPSEGEQSEDDVVPKSKIKKAPKSCVPKATASSTKTPSASKNKMNRSGATGTKKNMINLTKGRAAADHGNGLDLSLPPLHDNMAIFQDMTARAMGMGLADAAQNFNQQPLKVATMCSGTEAPVLALMRIQEHLKSVGVTFHFEHIFSAEIEPFKQAYIQRNFNPPLLFRDLTEFTGMHEGSAEATATTPYGSVQVIPTEIGMLIVGSPCVDFSNLNNGKKGIDDGGESGTVLTAVMDYCRAARPRIVILENIKQAPWDTILERFENMGYISVGFHVDTKDFYLPHTRQRGYMICYDRERLSGGDASALKDSTSATMKEFKRPASSPVSAFLQPAASISESTLAHAEDVKKKISWDVCHTRHITYREKLGIDGRPYTNWQESGVTIPPDFSDIQAISEQPDRVKDFLDIAHLRKLDIGGRDEPIDSRFKERYWDITQNIDIAHDVNPSGIIPCITASCAFVVPHLGRFLTGTELLMLQGIPLDLISFTTETANDLTDLAGNAMSAPVVGAAMLSALIAGHSSSILKPEIGEPTYGNKARVMPPVSFTRNNSVVTKAPNHEKPSNVGEILALAVKTARHCACEGHHKITPKAIQACRDCGHTSCVSCGGNPEHDYNTDQVLTKARLQPSRFIDKVDESIPLRMKLSQVSIPNTLPFSSKLDKQEAEMYLKLVKSIVSETYCFKECRRSTHWTVVYVAESSGSQLELLLNQGSPQWRLFGRPPQDLPGNSVIRQLFDQPIAKAEVETSFFDLTWQIRTPLPSRHLATAIATGPSVPTLWGRYFRGRENHTQPSQITLECPKSLSADVGGVYRLLPRCGTSMDSLYQRSGPGNPLYLFHDPFSAGPPKFDPFVFSCDKERVDQGSVRLVEACMDPTWRPWNMGESQETLSILEYDWTPCPQSRGLQEVTLAADVRTTSATDMSSRRGKCEELVEMVNVSTPRAADLDEQLSGAMSWVSALIRRNVELNT